MVISINLSACSEAFVFASVCRSGRASLEWSFKIVQHMLCVFACACTCVSCVQTKIIQRSAWEYIHALVCHIIPSEWAGGPLCLLQSLEGKTWIFLSVVHVCWEQESGYTKKDRVGTFKLPPALCPKHHPPPSVSMFYKSVKNESK